MTTQHPKQPPIFEFTKRKRWADILISELPETIILILSPALAVLYCGSAVSDLLGWSVEDLLDTDITLFINDEDKISFAHDFHHALHLKQHLFSYARLKCKREFLANPNHSPSPKELLFEIKGHPHYIPDDPDCKYFFAMAKLYPSRNTAVLNTFLELKIENERLSQRLSDLRSRPVPSLQGSMPPPLSLPLSMNMPSQLSQYSPAAYSLPGSRIDDLMPSPTRSNFDALAIAGYGHSAGYAAPLSATDDGDDDLRKKKLKKSHSTESQYVCVTCGRTDSPEWRKGPLGPKTLCNACGLRWSKKSRKHDDAVVPPPGAVPMPPPHVPGPSQQPQQQRQQPHLVPSQGASSSWQAPPRGAGPSGRFGF